MAKQITQTAADFIVPLNVNGLAGRMLHAPATNASKKTGEILLVYDQHSSLERWWPLAQELRRYSTVTMPDMPGFGGMMSFYRLSQPATIDNLASYMAAFIKMRYKRKPVTIVGVGFGFVVVTRMFQLYPDLARKVRLLVALDGYAHHRDLKYSMNPRIFNILIKHFYSHRLPAIFYRNVMLHPWVLRSRNSQLLHVGLRTINLAGFDKESRETALRTNISLWRLNDTRTYMSTAEELLRLDNCTRTVELQVCIVTSRDEPAFDNFSIEQHLGVVYKKVTSIVSDTDNYAATGLLPLSKPASLLPRKLRSMLNK